METVEGGDLDGRVNRRSPEVPFFCSSFQEPEFEFRASFVFQVVIYFRDGSNSEKAE